MENKKRSNSFDTLNSSVAEDCEMSAMEIELLNSILQKQQLKKRREGYAHAKLQQWSWFCCSFRPKWQRKYLTLTQDRLILGASPENHNGVHMMLSELSVSVSNDPGHLNHYFCLTLSDSKQQIELSLQDKQEMEHWLGKFQDAIQSTPRSYFYA